MPEVGFDVVVVGAGPAGEVVAGRVAERGKRVALVERHLIGGECSFYACMPSKALLRPAEVLAEAGRVPGAAEAVRGGLDAAAVLDRRDEVIHHLSDESQLPWLEERDIALFRGEAKLEGERRVRVADQLLGAREAVVLAVGTAADMPPIPGLAAAHAWSNRELTTAQAVPGTLLVLGGGVVGVEMAAAWTSLGARVTLIEAGERVIATEEPIASDAVHDGLEAEGVALRLGATVVEAARTGSGLALSLESGERLLAERLLVAVGRKPLTDELGLETVGLQRGGFVEVDDAMRVPGLPWLYAIGDVNGRSLLTHSGKYQGRIAADAILGERVRARSDATGAPRVIFTQPQVAAVGLTLAQARDAGHRARAIDVGTNANAGGSFYGRGERGTTRFVVDLEREILLGVTFVGAEVLEFVHAATIAVSAEVPLRVLAHAVAPFPTRSELWLKFLEAYERERSLSLLGEAL